MKTSGSPIRLPSELIIVHCSKFGFPHNEVGPITKFVKSFCPKHFEPDTFIQSESDCATQLK